MVNRPTGESDGVEDHNAGRTEGVRGNRVFAAAHYRAPRDQTDSNKETKRDPYFGRNQVVLE